MINKHQTNTQQSIKVNKKNIMIRHTKTHGTLYRASININLNVDIRKPLCLIGDL